MRMECCADPVNYKAAAAYLRLGPSASGTMWTSLTSITSCTMPTSSAELCPWATSCWRSVANLDSCRSYKRHGVAHAGLRLLSGALAVCFL